MHYTLCDYLIDIIENSIQADSTVISVDLTETISEIRCSIVDNGKGMNEETIKKALDPFYTEDGKHPNRRFGFGLPFLVQAVSAAGGKYELNSRPGKGTELKFNIDLNNVDAPPLGNIVSTIMTAISYEGNHELLFKRGRGDESFLISRTELAEVLGNLTEVQNLSLVKQYIESQEENLK